MNTFPPPPPLPLSAGSMRPEGRDARGRFIAGNSGRPKGARSRLITEFPLAPYIPQTVAPGISPEPEPEAQSSTPAPELKLSEHTRALLDETPPEGDRSDRIMAAESTLRDDGLPG